MFSNKTSLALATLATCLAFAPSSFAQKPKTVSILRPDGQPIPNDGNSGPKGGQLITSRLEVWDEDFYICDLNLRVDIDYPFWTGNLIVNLVRRYSDGSREEAVMAYENCGQTDNLKETFDDQATKSLPHTPGALETNDPVCDDGGDHVKPWDKLSTFNGLPIWGTWELEVFEKHEAYFGRLNEWELIATPCVDCGGHDAASCEECPQDGQENHGAFWCNGDCVWRHDGVCAPSNGQSINCGAHRASTCPECPQGHGQAWCHGDCAWRHDDGICVKP